MGYVEVGGDGSVHWNLDHVKKYTNDHTKAANNKKADGANNVPPSEIGKDWGAPSGHFRLEVIYKSSSEAKDALATAKLEGSAIVLFVKSNTENVEPVPPQIVVKW